MGLAGARTASLGCWNGARGGVDGKEEGGEGVDREWWWKKGMKGVWIINYHFLSSTFISLLSPLFQLSLQPIHVFSCFPP